MTLFEKCIEVVLKSEGGYQCDPKDIGNWINSNDYQDCKLNDFSIDLVNHYKEKGTLIGTKFGIAAKFFFLIVNERYGLSIPELQEYQAKELFHDYFWQPMNLDGIRNPDLALHIFDHGINAGKRTAIRMVQRIVGVKADGVCGPVTSKAINTVKPPTVVVEGYGLLTSVLDHYKYARYRYYTDLTMRRPVTKKYLKGWYNRIYNCHF